MLQTAALFAIKDESTIAGDKVNVHWRTHHLKTAVHYNAICQ